MASNLSPEADDGDVATAVGQYALSRISLGKAAERAGMSRWEFEEFLRDAGFTALYGPRTQDALGDELDAAIDLDE